MKPKLSIIILDFYQPNRDKFTRTIKSFNNQVGMNFKWEIVIILINKQKKQIVQEILEKKQIHTKNIRIFVTKHNLGYAFGNNIGVEKADGDLVLISNPDVEFDKFFLRDLIKSYEKITKKIESEKIILSPRICNYDGKIEFSRRDINFLGYSNPDIAESNKIKRTLATSGCMFLVKKNYFQEIGGFEKFYFMYHEDIDFSIRAEMKGFKQYVDNSLRVYHLRSDTDYRLNAFKYYFHERNRIIMTIQHSTKKLKMTLSHLLFEPLHLFYAISQGYLKERIKIYKFFVKYYRIIWRSTKKENTIFDKKYTMAGIFNEVSTDGIAYKLLDLYSKCLWYFYHH